MGFTTNTILDWDIRSRQTRNVHTLKHEIITLIANNHRVYTFAPPVTHTHTHVGTTAAPAPPLTDLVSLQ